MSRCFSILPAVLPLFALSACVEAPEDMLGTEAQAAIACPKLWGCGENSPVMGPFNFHELALDGQPNDADVRLIDLRLGVTSYQPRIVNGSQLVGYDPATNTTISGAQLTGAYFRLWSPEGLFKITIKKVTPQALSFTTFWIGPQTKIETYELTTNKVNSTDPVPLCDNPPERDSGEGPGRLWARPFEAMFFTGDRYDAESKTLIADNPRAAYPWFNIACAGSAIAKLHLTRHTYYGQTAGFTSTMAQRQAMLKMYTSDLCGGGAALYGLAALALGTYRLGDIKAMLRRKA
jgi:hypothetical protein